VRQVLAPMQAIYLDIAERILHIGRDVMLEVLRKFPNLLGHRPGLFTVICADDEKVRDSLGESETNVHDVSGQVRQRRDEEVLKGVLIGRRTDELSQATNESRVSVVVYSQSIRTSGGGGTSARR